MSFRLKTILGIAAIEFTVMLALILVNQLNFGGTASGQLYERAEATSRLFAAMVSDAVISLDLATIDVMVANTLKNDELIYLQIVDTGNTTLSEGGDTRALALPFVEDADFDAAMADHRIDIGAPILTGGHVFGQVRLGMATASVEEEIALAVRWNIIGGIVGMALVAVFGFLLGSVLTSQLSSLRDGALGLQAGDLDTRIPVRGHDELAQTARCFNDMADSLARDRAELLQRQAVLVERRESTDRVVECMNRISRGEKLVQIPHLERQDEIGDMARASAVFRETMRLNEEARHEQQRLLEAIDRVDEQVAIFDTDGRVLFANKSFRTFNAATLDTLPDRFAYDEYLRAGARNGDYPDAADPDAGDRVAAYRKASGPGDGPAEVARRGGYHLLVRETEIAGLGFVVTAADVTELRASAAQLIHASKLATLGEMAAGLAHELNQPLGVIRMGADNCMRRIAKGTADDAYLNAKLTRIADQTARAARIIDHMRIFGRKDSGEKERFSPVAAIEDAVNMMRAQLSGSGIALTCTLCDEEHEVLGSRTMFEQVIVNLLSNALDAVNGLDGVEGHILIEAQYADGIVVVIRDNGGGIPPAVLARLFEPFFTTKDPGRGTGLGLSIAHSVIGELNGTITAGNIDGGAQFTITVPVVEG